MHPIFSEPSPYQRLRTLSDPANDAHDTMDAGASLRVDGTRNTRRASASAARSAPPSPHVKVRHAGNQSDDPVVHKLLNPEKRDAAVALQRAGCEEFQQKFSKAKRSLRYFDEFAKKAYQTYPFQAENLHKKVEEYAVAAQQLLQALSANADVNDAPGQRQALNRLLAATHALIDAFPEWEQRSMTSSPSFRDFLHTLMGKPKPLADVQKHLHQFSIWLESKSALLNNQIMASVTPSQNHFDQNFVGKQA